VTLTDTPDGLKTTVTDNTTHQTGTMVASAANGFGQIKYQPGGHSCQELPYTFHPMYSTSSPQTRVLWAAHTYNIAFSDEIGHFDFCTHINPNSATASCDGLEDIPGDQEAADGDDNFCFSATQSQLYPATGCTDSNAPGFDGVSYQKYWPDGSSTRPTPHPVQQPEDGLRLLDAVSAARLRGGPATDRGGRPGRQLPAPHHRRELRQPAGDR
jgi:hypothetical protein